MYLEIFVADFVAFHVFGGISRDFAGPRPREISEALKIVVIWDDRTTGNMDPCCCYDCNLLLRSVTLICM